MKMPVLVALVVLAAAPLYARLGETEPQLIQRYGKPVMRSDESTIEQGKIYKVADRLHFRVDDWTLIAVVISGRCESIQYYKHGEWTEQQFRHVLEVNGGRGQWHEEKTPAPKMMREWIRLDKARAQWRLTQSMTLTSPAYDQAREALKKRAKEEASKLPKL